MEMLINWLVNIMSRDVNESSWVEDMKLQKKKKNERKDESLLSADCQDESLKYSKAYKKKT